MFCITKENGWHVTIKLYCLQMINLIFLQCNYVFWNWFWFDRVLTYFAYDLLALIIIKAKLRDWDLHFIVNKFCNPFVNFCGQFLARVPHSLPPAPRSMLHSLSKWSLPQGKDLVGYCTSRQMIIIAKMYYAILVHFTLINKNVV